MRNNGAAASRHRATTGTRRPLWVAVGLLIAVVVMVTAGPTAAVPPPPNPSDGEIAGATAQVDAQVTEVGALINQVAVVDQQVRVLDDAVALKREEVNKALVDLQNARAAADAAAAAVVDSQQQLTDAGTKVDQARRNFDQFATQVYTQPAAGSMMTFLSAATPDAALDKAELVTLVTKNKQSVLSSLHRTQIEQGNKNSDARAARLVADAAAADAEVKKADAEHAVVAAKAELDQQTVQRDDLLRQRAAAQGRLDAARVNVAGLHDQRDTFLAWDEQRRIEEAETRAAAAAAAERAGADQNAQGRAAQAGDGKRPHTQLEYLPPPQSMPHQTMPSVRGSEAVEVVVDRAMSQLGVIYAWGGGDEDGPTLGIRDGGVADAHGDFEKVGFDCSGLMIYAFAGVGVSLPHYSGYQYTAGTQIPVRERARGDMLFWGASGSQHVALYLGNGKMVEAPQSGEVVKVSAVREAGIMPFAVRIVD